jgi:3-oxoacyl-[acyl-carrier protein] reductase
MRLDGQVALVTGASRGIGRAVAIRLGGLGATVVVGYRSDDEAAASVVEQILSAGAPAARAIRADLAAPGTGDHLVAAALALGGRLDVLVNNAGIQRSAPIHRMTDIDWQQVIDVNLSAVFYATRAALRWMREQRSGRIINVASASSFMAQPGAASYVAAKHGLIGLTRATAVENASRNILVNAVAPGLTQTDMVTGLSPQQQERLTAMVPLQRIGHPDEVAEMVAFVATTATYSTGNVFHVGGGVVMS